MVNNVREYSIEEYLVEEQDEHDWLFHRIEQD